jgi:hypothetical protein
VAIKAGLGDQHTNLMFRHPSKFNTLRQAL